MQSAIEKAQHIRLLILDIDGTMTSGVVYFDSQGRDMRGFHLHDGLGIKLLQRIGIEIAVISGKKSDSIALRINELSIKHAYLGHDDKLPAYDELKQKLGLQDDVIAYMGDDLPDLPLLRRAGLAITVPQAPEIIREHSHLVTKRKAGKGAVREACEFILEAQGKFQSVLESYLV